MLKYVVLLFAVALAVPQSLVDEVNAKQKSWVASRDHPVARMERSEYRRLLGLDLTVGGVHKHDQLTYSAEAIAAAPESFDSRVNWPNCDTMKDIRDQSDCGSCWAFGAVESMSDRECVFNKRNVRISAEDMNSCAKEYEILSCGSCNGGNPGCTLTYWKNTGVVTDQCRPYSLPGCDHHIANSSNPCPSDMYPTPACDKTCSVDKTLTWEGDKHKASKTYTVSGEANMMTEISTNGPCEGAFTVYADFVAYKSGIYHYVSGAKEGGHAIKILGYGTDNGEKYWLIANSWNKHFGEDGYFRIRRGTNECGIEAEMWCGIPVLI